MELFCKLPLSQTIGGGGERGNPILEIKVSNKPFSN
jgi:hypothetical protein